MKQSDTVKFKDWATEDKPREKLMKRGIESLTDAELLAILINTGTKQNSVIDLARKVLMAVDHDLNRLAKLTIEELSGFEGIGTTKAISLITALELGKRRAMATIMNKQQIRSSKEVGDLFCPLLGDLPHEEFWVLFLNGANKIIDKRQVSKGGVGATYIDVRIVMKAAIMQLASGIILCHNHPSGNLAPSQEDINLTHRLIQAGKLLEVRVWDHIIVSDTDYFSFVDENLI